MLYKRQNSFIADYRDKYCLLENKSLSDSFKLNNNVIFWNDWFGRPGNGAPICNAYEKNLNEMLEPRRNTADEIENYNRTFWGLKSYKSNHQTIKATFTKSFLKIIVKT